MSNLSEHHVYFAVTGFGDDLDLVTRIMRTPPSKAWTKGELWRGSGRHMHSRWTLQSRLALTESVEKHFEDLLNQLDGREEAVHEVSRRFSARISLAAYWRERIPSFELSAYAVKRISMLGLSIDFDLYNLIDQSS